MSRSQQQICWQEHLKNIEEMRSERNAPVDSMGCEQICDKSAPPEVSNVSLFWLCYYLCAALYICSGTHFLVKSADMNLKAILYSIV